MKAIGKYIIIKTIEEQIETKSGLLLGSGDMQDIRYKKGKVVTPGTEVTAISKDDTVYYDRRSGHTMMIKNEKYGIIQERDVVVVL
jgi:co-chaperonin GroES (HSP10)|tara:strand:- start:611 stop:868 length:258 start_codon:yes stop_codon:yes gene_type:complete